MWLIDFLLKHFRRKKPQHKSAKNASYAYEELPPPAVYEPQSPYVVATTPQPEIDVRPAPYALPAKYAHDAAQRAAICIDTGSHLVLAPPGCGKTDILAERVAYALSKGTLAANMLCLTFTNRAARTMQERLHRRLGSVPGSLFVGNIHRFCSRFLFSHNVVPAASTIIDDVETEKLLKTLKGLPEDAPLTSAEREILWLVYKAQHQRQQLRSGHARELLIHPNVDQTFVHAKDVEAFEAYKEEYHLIDFDDILVLAYDFMCKHPDDYKRYEWIQIDEVQDLNGLQLSIVKLLATRAPKSTVVYLGDEQQAIYSFMGARSATLERLKEECQGRVHRLQLNYRSPLYLLNIFNTYAANRLGIDARLLPEAVHHNAMPNGATGLLSATDQDEECLAVLRLAQKLVATGERTAILVPSNDRADEVSHALAEQPHFKLSGKDLFQTPLVKTAFAHLNVLTAELNMSAWTIILKTFAVFDRLDEGRKFLKAMQGCLYLPSDFLLRDAKSYVRAFVEHYESDMVVFDTETTGLNVRTDDIVQLSAIRLRRGRIVSHFDVLLSTPKVIPAEVDGKPNPLCKIYATREHSNRKDGLLSFLQFVDSSPLLGHNVGFDLAMLHFNLLRDCEINPFAQRFSPCYDTLTLARMVEPRLPSYKLKDLVAYLHLEGHAPHLASTDALATKSLADSLVQKARPLLKEQRAFRKKYATPLKRFIKRYGPLYAQARSRFFVCEPPSAQSPLATEFLHCSHLLVHKRYAKPEERISLVARFIDECLIGPSQAPTLYEQLRKYAPILCTLKEADLCNAIAHNGSPLIGEQLFVSTVHKAKGLEFENVIVMGANDGTYPHYANKRLLNEALALKQLATTPADRQRAHEQEAAAHALLQEDARILYVAMTRAKKRLYFSFHQRNCGISPHGQFYDFETPLSPFVQSIVPLLHTEEAPFP